MADLQVSAAPAHPVLDGLLDQLPVGVAELDPAGQWLRTNRHLQQMLGYSGGGPLPPTLDDLTHPEDRDVDRINVDLMTTGVVDAYRQERRLRRFDGSFLWVDTSLCATRRTDGKVDRLAAVIHDISRYKEVQQRQQTLLAELAHRGRNLFAILQSLARYSFSGNRSPDEAYAAFHGRLRALSDSLNTLMDRDFGGTRLDLLMRRELRSLGARAAIEGPAVMLSPNAAQTFALILHELATNATKYGALSADAGSVSVAWTVTGTGEAARLAFEWREFNGPPATATGVRGFGTILTTEVAGADFDCQPRATYGVDGLEYRFDAPLARVGALVTESPLRRRLKDRVITTLYDSWARERARAGGLPNLVHFGWSRFAATGAMTLGKVLPDGSVRITRIGRALVERLGRPLSEEQGEAQELDGARELYRRCARIASPCNEYLRFNFGADEPLTLERLIVPFAESPDGPVSHLIGIAIFTGRTDDPSKHPHPEAA